ncbi:LLM class flavin-dependent oxidoreductase [Xylophilus sp.]|uniref:LLM class flavin-dependent oxidoreductase n=1 Tax=Xylophilus sp. TaxID=2653893 RepID=UPI0013B86F62|nr:LLM class flavin-dependent oxidoreductase [Xylophilus sp.]KAF1042889.1 MAG: Alkanesulfonate monooxygenase [Xylophilus sp.]
MTVEFIGYVAAREQSEIIAPQGPVVDARWISTVAQAREYVGFDRALVAYSSSSPDAFQIAAYAAHETKTLKLLLAHRPGFVFPTLAARQLATLDHFSEGRLAVHIISGGNDAEQQRDGDFLGHAERYERTDEYLDVVRQTWTASEPFDHTGRHYRLVGNQSGVKPLQTVGGQPQVPIYFGGSSDAAIRVAGKHADVYALWGEPLAQVRETVAKVRAAAALYGRERHVRFSLSLRPIIAATEEAAWAKADDILERARGVVAQSPRYRERLAAAPQNVGSQWLLEAAGRGKVVDARLWTELAALTSAAGNSTSLVGTPEQVAQSLLDYHDAGISTFLIRGFRPLQDALDYGRHLIPLVREEIARRSRSPEAVAA